jgi:large subunit ribosomal protein L3
MTSSISDDGAVQAVTLLAAGPCTVARLKSTETDNYNAVQLGFEEAGKNHVGKSVMGQFKNLKTLPKIIREFRVDELPEDLAVGNQLTSEIFFVGDQVDVVGTSKGKGWAGTIKRHNFHRQRKTHGGKGNTRKVGSIGSMYPQHILKGKKMAGQMGHEQVTVKRLTVAHIDPSQNLIAVKGAVPGPRKGLVTIREAK